MVCWGGAFDGKQTLPSSNGPLPGVLAVVIDEGMGIVTYCREAEVRQRPVVGFYVLRDASAGLWRHGLRYQFQTRWWVR